MVFMGKIFNALSFTREAVSDAFDTVLKRKVSLESMEQLEDALIFADLGFDTVEAVMSVVRRYRLETQRTRRVPRHPCQRAAIAPATQAGQASDAGTVSYAHCWRASRETAASCSAGSVANLQRARWAMPDAPCR